MAFFPAAVATTANLYTAVNSLQTTLSTALGTGDTSVVLASATGFPTAGAVVIGNEVIFYTGVSGATLTGCTRGADGTTAATHSVGVPVGAAIVAFHHNGLMTEVIAVETFLNTKFGTSGSAYTVSRALQTNSSSGIPEVSSVTNTELGYLSGVTSAIQTQMDLKAPKASPTFTGTVVVPTPFTVGAVSVTATGTEMNYLVGVTSAIQTQLGLKAPLASPAFTGTVTQVGQPCFAAYNSTDRTNQTGLTNADVTVPFDTELYDIGSNFASNTFTAPTTGKYFFTAQIRVAGLTAAMLSHVWKIKTTARQYDRTAAMTPTTGGSIGGAYTYQITAFADMTAGDTATVTLNIFDGAANSVTIVGSAVMRTYFAGSLIN